MKASDGAMLVATLAIGVFIVAMLIGFVAPGFAGVVGVAVLLVATVAVILGGLLRKRR